MSLDKVEEMDFDGWKRRHDPVSLSALLESVEPRVERICRRILRDPHDAEEAKQEVLLEIAKGVVSVVDAAHFDRWVGKVAFRTALDRRRMRLRRVAHESRAGERLANCNGPDDALHESMSRLEDEDRDLLIERYFDRRTLREMGRRRGISAVAIRKRIAGAQDRLKRMLGSFVALGAVVVKTKSAASVAVIVLPLLLLGGAWLAASRDPARKATTSSTGLNPGFFSSSPDGEQREPPTNSIAAIEAPPPEFSTEDKSAQREAFQRNLRRYKAMYDRCQECENELMSEIRTGGGWKEIRKELEELLKDMRALADELREQTRVFPEECLSYFQELEWSHVKKEIGWFLRPVIDAELEKDPSTPGPYLKALMELSRGTTSEKQYLAGYSRDLKIASPDLARFCLGAIEDPDPDLRYSAMRALGILGDRGNLGPLLAEHKAKLQELALTGRKERLAAFAYTALAAIGEKDTDEFILTHWSASTTREQIYDSIWAVNKMGPRIAVSHEALAASSLARFLEMEYESKTFIGVVKISLHLSTSACVQILRLAANKAPAKEVGMANGLENIIRRVEAGEAAEVRAEIDKLGAYDFPIAEHAIRTVGRVDVSSLK